MFYKKRLNRLEDHLIRLAQTTAYLKRDNQLLKDRLESLEDYFLKKEVDV